MLLVEFVNSFDFPEDTYVVIENDCYINYNKWAEHDFEYEEIYRGKMSDIPIGYGSQYVIPFNTVLEDNILYIRTRDRQGE